MIRSGLDRVVWAARERGGRGPLRSSHHHNHRRKKEGPPTDGSPNPLCAALPSLALFCFYSRWRARWRCWAGLGIDRLGSIDHPGHPLGHVDGWQPLRRLTTGALRSRSLSRWTAWATHTPPPPFASARTPAPLCASTRARGSGGLGRRPLAGSQGLWVSSASTASCVPNGWLACVGACRRRRRRTSGSEAPPAARHFVLTPSSHHSAKC